MKNPFKLFELLLADYRWFKSQPATAKRAFLAGKTFAKDEFAAAAMRALIVCEGDWRAAAEFLKFQPGLPLGRLKTFCDWCNRLTSPARRGLLLCERNPQRRGLLLTWKGGAK